MENSQHSQILIEFYILASERVKNAALTGTKK